MTGDIGFLHGSEGGVFRLDKEEGNNNNDKNDKNDKNEEKRGI